MSLGLFNCRLIQPAGDQLFFLAGCLAAPVPVRASSVQSPCAASCSAPTSGRAQNASCFSFSERFLFWFSEGQGPSPRGVHEGSLPPIHPRIPPKIPKWETRDIPDNRNGDQLLVHRLVLRWYKHDSQPGPDWVEMDL